MERLTVMTDKGAALMMGGPYKSKKALRDDLMKRYTVSIDRLSAYEDTGLEPERVAELAQAEKDGRLVVLPCKVGDKVWVIMENREIYSFIVRGISMSATCTDTILRFSDSFQWGSNIGKTWFLTRQEAEEALRKESFQSKRKDVKRNEPL